MPEGEEADGAAEEPAGDGEPAEAEAVVEEVTAEPDEPAEEEAVIEAVPDEETPDEEPPGEETPGEETEDEVYDLTEVVEEADGEAIEAPETDGEGEAVVMAQAAAQSDLMSDDTVSMATSQLGGLVAAVAASETGTPLGRANLTIEDLVKDVMRPMIREWLDGNLPGLVERAVRREVERLSRRAEDE